MLIDFTAKTSSERYKLMAGSVVPRPIAWIVTQGEVLNMAPFSYFTPLSSEPATMIVSIGHRVDGTPKDTLRNLRENKKCIICIVDDEHFEKMHLSSKALEADKSELAEFDIATESLLEEYPPVPKDIKIAYFCEYLQEVDLSNSKTIPTIVEIKHLYINDTIISNTEKLSFEVDAIGRVGRGYAKLGDDVLAPEFP
ncbi:MAG: Nitrilotriacetate monooxygenase component B (EC [uncultured Sulfurovum sp.]|uniref:Nitrilotriacetate monooxygenase component B (EC) n=1 Tax=uncultured Sulfurovum sp. TaxID=269237 RepID=A0A6S6UIK0_9BACT|nr:MAG: Nitrilotriacetate monooxygenase component B (EC [uncultured Sulfurovum sp.]